MFNYRHLLLWKIITTRYGIWIYELGKIISCLLSNNLDNLEIQIDKFDTYNCRDQLV